MINNNWVNKEYDDLDKIITHHSYNSYLQANFKNGKRIKKKHIPYLLNDECLEALRLKKICLNDVITKEEEEEIKSFLIFYRIQRPEFLV